MLESPPMSNDDWKSLVVTRITAWFEQDLRNQARNNSKMEYLNVQLLGLSGRPHPALHNVNTTQDCKKLRHHLKFLTGDILTGARLSKNQPGSNPACKLCLSSYETIEHILTVCPALSDVHQRLYPELMNVVNAVQPSNKIMQSHSTSILTQFILDCTSMNLENDYRIPANNPNIHEIFSLSRDWCLAVANSRTKQLSILKNT